MPFACSQFANYFFCFQFKVKSTSRQRQKQTVQSTREAYADRLLHSRPQQNKTAQQNSMTPLPKNHNIANTVPPTRTHFYFQNYSPNSRERARDTIDPASLLLGIEPAISIACQRDICTPCLLCFVDAKELGINQTVH